ncbi:MAG: hypothetical protein LUC94_14865 [Clostridiales bacterium]|nr:hypothetical protein [Clostridiales bacterium]
MATSSIFHNFTITDEKSAECFVDALDKAAQQPAWKSKLGYKPPVRDPEVLRAMMARRNEKHE